MNIRRWIKNNRIGVLCGGLSAEREISLTSGKAVLNALCDLGADAVLIDAGHNLPFDLRDKKIDFSFISLHGPWGEDGTVQGLLETMGIPYSGCGVLSSALCMNKIVTKRMLDWARLPTPSWKVARKNESVRSIGKLPLVIKPSTQGSAIGVSVVRNKKDVAAALSGAFKFDRDILVEKFIPGTEISAGILGRNTLPVIEIVPKAEFYDFDSKYQPGQSQHFIPPRLPKKVLRQIEDIALKTFEVMGCAVAARIDMIVDKSHKPWILEINTIPGMTPTSLFPDVARAAGIDFSELVVKIIEYSLEK